MVNLGNYYAKVARHTDAVKFYGDALSLLKAKYPDHKFTMTCMLQMATCYEALERRADVLTLREELLALMKRKLGPQDRGTLWAMSNLAISYAYADRMPEAIALEEEAMRLQKIHLRPDDPLVMPSMSNLAYYLMVATDAKSRDPAQAVKLATKATELAPKQPAPWSSLGMARYRLGEWKQAIKVLEKALSLTRPDDPEYADTGFFLAMAYWQDGEHEKSLTCFAKAAQRMEKSPKENIMLKRIRAEAAQLLGVEKKN
jgi:tetratricopeptide (TPR) repeat protein